MRFLEKFIIIAIMVILTVSVVGIVEAVFHMSYF
jgi:hypothetical protein